jgi:integrase
VNGRDVVKNLGVEVRGEIPPSLREMGDAVFERSRAQAQAALDRFQEDLRKRSTAEELVQTIHEIRTGERIHSMPIVEVFRKWKVMPRRRPPSPRYMAVSAAYFQHLVDFLVKVHPNVKYAEDVQAGMAREFLLSESERGISPKTYNNELIFLRSCFEALKTEAVLAQNPFEGIPTKEENTVFRKPFTTDELKAIIEAAKSDPFIYPIVVTGMCTAMRRGVCCLLKWESVNLRKRFISVKTSKTGETVQIPIFPLLEEVLSNAVRTASDYVFPEQAAMYQQNPDGITLRVRKVLEQAGFGDIEDDEGGASEGGVLPATVSRGQLHQERKKGLRRASIRDFHSFRVTWVTLALTAGIPIELVQRVTGHRTAQIVEKHYFQPDAEDFRNALTGKLPAIMAGGGAKPMLSREELRAKIESQNAKNWAEVRRELLESL